MPKKSSAAAARRRRQEILARREVVELPKELREFLDGYRPHRTPAEVWAATRPLVVSVMERAHVRVEASFRQHAADVAALAAWALRTGQPLTLEALMRHSVVDEFVRVGMDGSDNSRATRRSRLRSLASHVNPGPDAPPPPPPIGHVVIRPPYTRVEMASIERIALTQPTTAMRRQMCACVGLGAGAGIDSTDLQTLRRSHIDDRGEHGILGTTTGQRGREIVVRRCCEELVRIGIDGLRSNELVIGTKPNRKNVAGKVFENATILGQAPPLSQGRLRSTWLAALMTSAVPLAVILQVAGLRSARTLTDLASHLPPVTIDGDALRGAEA